MHNGGLLVSFPDPALKEGKGLVHIERFLGCTGCSISCDWHDNASFWYGNASTAFTCVQYTAIGQCHMIIACKPHGGNLIGVLKFLTEMSSRPRKRSMCTRTVQLTRILWVTPGFAIIHSLTCIERSVTRFLWILAYL